MINIFSSLTVSIMTRSELILSLRDKFTHLTLEDIDDSVKLILNEISNKLAKGNRVEIRSFGTFDVKYRQPRVSRNPKTGERVDLTERYVPHFRAGRILQKIVNQ
jgi:integration host factor subunit beta